MLALGRCGGIGLGLVSGLGFSDTRVDFLFFALGLVWFGLVWFVLGLVWFVGLGWAGLGWVGRDKRERRVETGFDDRDLTAACVRATV